MFPHPRIPTTRSGLRSASQKDICARRRPFTWRDRAGQIKNIFGKSGKKKPCVSWMPVRRRIFCPRMWKISNMAFLSRSLTREHVSVSFLSCHFKELEAKVAFLEQLIGKDAKCCISRFCYRKKKNGRRCVPKKVDSTDMVQWLESLTTYLQRNSTFCLTQPHARSVYSG